jgi:hypothetical protein
VYDANGKAAGLTLVPLRSDSGHIETGPARQLITDNAQAAILLKSQNGETLVVNTLQEGLTAAREHPKYGVMIMAKDVEPSAQLMKVSGGKIAVSEGIVSLAAQTERASESVVIPDEKPGEQGTPEMPDSLVRSLVDDYSRYADIDMEGDESYAQYRDHGEEKLAQTLKSDNPEPGVPDIASEKGKDIDPDSYGQREKQLADKLLDTSIDDRQLVSQVRGEQLREQREIERPELTPEHVKHIQKER